LVILLTRAHVIFGKEAVLDSVTLGRRFHRHPQIQLSLDLNLLYAPLLLSDLRFFLGRQVAFEAVNSARSGNSDLDDVLPMKNIKSGDAHSPTKDGEKDAQKRFGHRGHSRHFNVLVLKLELEYSSVGIAFPDENINILVLIIPPAYGDWVDS